MKNICIINYLLVVAFVGGCAAALNPSPVIGIAGILIIGLGLYVTYTCMFGDEQ